MAKSKAPTDFNDLKNEAGANAVADAFGEPPDSPAPSLKVLPRFDLDFLLEHFYVTFPDAQIWDSSTQSLMKKSAAKDAVGPKLFGQWLDHAERKSIDHGQCKRAVAAAQASGDGGVQTMLERYVYIFNSDECYDTATDEQFKVTNLRYTYPESYEKWLKSPHRRQVLRDALVFDPTQNRAGPGTINRFHGIEMMPGEPGEGNQACRNIIDLVDELCGGVAEHRDYLLKWMAYPLQNVGAKLASAVILHGEVHGSGKSLFFEEILRKIYGRYSVTCGQHELESPYNGWASGKLFCLFEEVLSRSEKHNQSGMIKHMVTGRTKRVNMKFINDWEEANYMNAVFLSNEHQPLPLEANDRRFFVLWVDRKLREDLRQGIIRELNNGGVEAFYGFLLQYPLDGFDPFTAPPMTDAKQAIIDFGRPAWDAFYREWESESLPIPYRTCAAKQLFEAFKHWCAENGERSTLSQRKFTSFIKTRVTLRRDQRYEAGGVKTNFYMVDRPAGQDGVERWFAERFKHFDTALDSWLNKDGAG